MARHRQHGLDHHRASARRRIRHRTALDRKTQAGAAELKPADIRSNAMAQIMLDRSRQDLFAARREGGERPSLEIPDGEFMVLVGPSGCGKSTALRIIAGLEDDHPTGPSKSATGRQRRAAQGSRHRDDLPELCPLPADDRGAEPGVRPADAQDTEERDRAPRPRMRPSILGLEPYLARKPAALSGGQRQRVAMGRAIVREPQAFLMDEPLSNLDAKLRVGMRASLAELHERLHVTTVYVTHDQVEAMTLGHRVCVLRDGMLQQVDTPQNLYDHPVNLFVGGFIGSPSMNIVTAEVTSDDDGMAVTFAGHRLAIPESSGARQVRGSKHTSAAM